MLSASRVLVAIAARSLADAGEESRYPVSLVSGSCLSGAADHGSAGRGRLRHGTYRISFVRTIGQEGIGTTED